MSARESLRQTVARLKIHKCPGADPIREASLLLRTATGRSEQQLITEPDRPLTDCQAKRLRRLTDRRLAHEPIEHLTGWSDFCGLRLKADPKTLIPRPATELLVGVAVRQLKQALTSTVVDVGTGSGAIALAIASLVPTAAPIIALDTSGRSLAVARSNARRLCLEHRIRFAKGDLLKPILPELKRQPGPLTIIANLPYVPEAAWEELIPEIRVYEPKEALTSGPDGLDHYRRLIRQLAALADRPLSPVSLYLEALPEQVAPLTAELNRLTPSLTVTPIDRIGLKAVATLY